MSARPNLRLGFIPLNDCAALVVAQEMGFFTAEGLDVTLSREASWANVRDKVAVGALDGAHMLAPLPLAMTLGVGSEPVAVEAPLALSLNGSAVTIATKHAEAMRALDPEGMARRPCTAGPLKRLIAMRREAGEGPLVFAVVFPFSMHNYELRYWLAEAGIDPDSDVRIVTTPPPRMATRLASGDIDGFCVSAPWNAAAVAQGTGEILIYASEIWQAGPDKVFGVRSEFSAREPDTLRALLRALLKGAVWADEPGNRGDLAKMLSRPDYVDAPEAIVRQSLVGFPPYSRRDEGPSGHDYMIYHRYAASFPWRSHALWFLSQMLRWGQIGADVNLTDAAERVFRPDAFRAAAAELGLPFPLVEEKVEGAHSAPWTLDEASTPIPMAPDLFFDARIFDAAQPASYAAGFTITRFRPAD